MREVVTLQFGRFANHVGSHFWNIQDELAVLDGSDDAEHDAERMLRGTNPEGGRECRVPRAVIVDRQGQMGVLGGHGLQFSGPEFRVDSHQAATTVQTWHGDITVAESEPLDENEFIRSTRSERWAVASGDGEGDTDDDGEDDKACEYGGDGDEGQQLQAPEEAHLLVPAAASGVDGRRFNLQGVVAHWADYLQVDVHPRSLVALPDFAHGYSDFDRHHHGLGLFRAHGGDGDPSALEVGEHLVDCVRRELEACDQPAGLLVLADVDDGFSGLAAGALEAIGDELGRFSTVCYGVGEHAASSAESGASAAKGPSEEATGNAGGLEALRRRTVNRSCTLASMTELSSLYLPAGVAQLSASAFPLIAKPWDIPFHSSALLAASLDTLFWPTQVRSGSLRLSLADLAAAATPGIADCRMCALSSALPLDVPSPSAGGAWSVGANLCLVGQGPSLRGPPARSLCVARGCDAGVAGLATRAQGSEEAWSARRVWDRFWATPQGMRGRGSLLRYDQPIHLPLPFPQFFDRSLARDGHVRRGATPPAAEEVYALRALARADCTAAHSAGLRAAAKDLAHARAAGDVDAELGALLAEAAERLDGLAEDYAMLADAGARDLEQSMADRDDSE